MPGTVCSMASTLEDRFTLVMRDPVGVASKANFVDDGLFSSSALSSPSCASNELMGFTAVNFQDRSTFRPSARSGSTRRDRQL
jgi:hypothetical protein